MSRKSKKSSPYGKTPTKLLTEDFIEKFKSLCDEFNCIKIPTVVIYEELKRLHHGVSIVETSSSHENELKIILGIKKSELTSIGYKNFPLETPTVLAIHKYASEFPFSLTVLKLENCNLTAEQIEILADTLQYQPVLQELRLNGNPNKKQNHYLLLDFPQLFYCSLKFCEINEEGITKICGVISNSRSLMYLNLMGNNLYDEGAKHISNMLRINRSLLAINLADNKIRDRGCIELMKPFVSFPLAPDELIIKRQILLEYFKTKLLKEDTSYSSAKGSRKTKSRSFSRLVKFGTKKGKIKNDYYEINKEEIEYHPFIHDIIDVDQNIVCTGNENVNSLNLSFNQIGWTGLCEIENTLYDQKTLEKHKGLSRVALEGNISYEECTEVIERIEELLRLKKEPTSEVTKGQKRTKHLSINKMF